MNLLADGVDLTMPQPTMATEEAVLNKIDNLSDAGPSGYMTKTYLTKTVSIQKPTSKPMSRNQKLASSIPLVVLFLMLIILLIVSVFQRK